MNGTALSAIAVLMILGLTVAMKLSIAGRASGLPAAFRHNDCFMVAADWTCANLTADVFPNVVMTLFWASDCMSDFMQDCVFNILIRVILDIVTGEGNSLFTVFAAASAFLGTVEFKGPVAETMLDH